MPRPTAQASTSTSMLSVLPQPQPQHNTTRPASRKGKERALDPPLIGHDLADIRTAGRIYAWADCPQRAAKCFAAHIVHAMAPLQAEGFPQSVYLLDQRPVIYAEIVGLIVGVTEKERRITYLVDDGTAVIQVVEAVNSLVRRRKPDVGDAVRVIGRIRLEWDKRALYTDRVEPCKDRHEENVHIHAVVTALTSSYSRPFELSDAPVAQPSTTLPIPSIQIKETTIPAAYLPPVYTNANYYSHAHRLNPTGPEPSEGPVLRTPESTPPAKSVARSSIAPSSGPYSIHSSPRTGSQAGQRFLRAWYKLKGSELSSSRFRPYVAQHIHHFCCVPSATPPSTSGSNAPASAPAFTVRYLRRQEDLRKHAERVVLRELEKRSTKSAGASSATSSNASRGSKGDHGKVRGQSAPLSSEKMAAKVKRLFESIIRQLVDDGVIEIVPESCPIRWPFNGRKVRFRPSKVARPGQSTTSFSTSKKWGGTAAEMFLYPEDIEVPFLGSSDSDSDQADPKGLKTPSRGRRRSFEVPSSSGASAVLDAHGRTRSPLKRLSTQVTPAAQVAKPVKKTKKMGTNPFDDAISIPSSSPGPSSQFLAETPTQRRQKQEPIRRLEVEDDSSSAGITSDTDDSDEDGSQSSESDPDESRRAGSPTPRAKRTLPLLADQRTRSRQERAGAGPSHGRAASSYYPSTQEAAQAWRTGVSFGQAGGRAGKVRSRPRQEAYRLVPTESTT